MTIHIAANVGCNLGCEYCYENPSRDMTKTEIQAEYDLDAIIDRLAEFKEKYNSVPGLHGGEPLMLPNEDIEEIFKWIHDNYNLEEADGAIHIQTNGTLVDEEVIDLFEEYDISVGVSIDGPGHLNSARTAKSGGEEITELMTQKTMENIERLLKSEVSHRTSVIVVLTKKNSGTDDRLDTLLEYIDWFSQMGVRGHFNPAIPYDGQEELSLSPERLKEIYLKTWEWMKEEDYREWDPMRNMQANLYGKSLKDCIFTKCDPYNTTSAKIVKGTGGTTGCGKTWATTGDGGSFLQGDSTGNSYGEGDERYEMLKRTPSPYSEEVVNGTVEDQGGCKGCHYWTVCRGGCPSSGLNKDHRNRSRWCEAYHALYKRIEQDERAMHPGIRLVTDSPWDLEHAPGTDILPFAKYRQDTTENNPDSMKGGILKEGVPSVEKAIREANGQVEGNFRGDVQRAKEQHGEENVTVDWERKGIQVDAARGDSTSEGSGGREMYEGYSKNVGSSQEYDSPNDVISKVNVEEEVDKLSPEVIERDIEAILEDEQLTFEQKVAVALNRYGTDSVNPNPESYAIHVDAVAEHHTDSNEEDGIEPQQHEYERPYEERLEEKKRNYPEETVTGNPETGAIHVDSGKKSPDFVSWDDHQDDVEEDGSDGQ